jgi:hypothetical protein
VTVVAPRAAADDDGNDMDGAAQCTTPRAAPTPTPTPTPAREPTPAQQSPRYRPLPRTAYTESYDMPQAARDSSCQYNHLGQHKAMSSRDFDGSGIFITDAAQRHRQRRHDAMMRVTAAQAQDGRASDEEVALRVLALEEQAKVRRGRVVRSGKRSENGILAEHVRAPAINGVERLLMRQVLDIEAAGRPAAPKAYHARPQSARW